VTPELSLHYGTNAEAGSNLILQWVFHISHDLYFLSARDVVSCIVEASKSVSFSNGRGVLRVNPISWPYLENPMDDNFFSIATKSSTMVALLSISISSQTSARGRPAASSIKIYSAPTELFASELHEKTLGTGIERKALA